MPRIRLGIEVKNGYLVLSNIPWLQPVTVKTIKRRDLNGAALSLVLGALRLGLPGLFATQSEQNQLANLHDEVQGVDPRRLGLAEGQTRRLLESGEVTELALVTPPENQDERDGGPAHALLYSKDSA